MALTMGSARRRWRDRRVWHPQPSPLRGGVALRRRTARGRAVGSRRRVRRCRARVATDPTRPGVTVPASRTDDASGLRWCTTSAHDR
jgi:hypothetical protein